MESLLKFKFLGPTTTDSTPVGLSRHRNLILTSTPDNFTTSDQWSKIGEILYLKDGNGERPSPGLSCFWFPCSAFVRSRGSDCKFYILQFQRSEVTLTEPPLGRKGIILDFLLPD